VERIGHRGAKRELRENTLAAFQRAFERGADAIELDVHATEDGVVVVHHDPDLGPQMGPLAGRRIAELRWGDFQAAQLADDLTVPTLAQVLAATPPTATVYVEIKGADIEQLVADAIRNGSARCAVHSFDHAAIVRMAAIAPEIQRGILFDERPTDVVASMRAAQARDVWPNWRLVDQALVDQIHAAGGRVIAWTVNSREAASDLAALGVDGVCTDVVRLLDGLIERRRGGRARW
jgi:glycerophosphoryl diester phosphodiesterase